jgi:hypothetical protein
MAKFLRKKEFVLLFGLACGFATSTYARSMEKPYSVAFDQDKGGKGGCNKDGGGDKGGKGGCNKDGGGKGSKS